MTFATDMQALEADIAGLIAQAGGTMTLRKPGSPTIDPVTGAVTSGTPTDAPVKGITGRYRTDEVDGTRIQAGDFPVTFAASDVPDIGDQLIIAGRTYSIITVNRISAADVDIVYQAQARGA